MICICEQCKIFLRHFWLVNTYRYNMEVFWWAIIRNRSTWTYTTETLIQLWSAILLCLYSMIIFVIIVFVIVIVIIISSFSILLTLIFLVFTILFYLCIYRIFLNFKQMTWPKHCSKLALKVLRLYQCHWWKLWTLFA